MTNLMRVLERTSDPNGQLHQRTERRLAELEQEFAEADARLQRHVASTPPEPEQNAGTRASPTSRSPRRTRRPMITFPKPQPLLTTKLCEARITTAKAVQEVNRDA